MGRRSKKEQIEKKGDRNFKDIKRQINKRNKRMQDEDIIEEIYVDSYRMISVNAGSGNDDLKAVMAAAGAKIKSDDKLAPGEPNMIMYLKLAEYMMRKGLFKAALRNISEAAEFNPDSSLVMLTAAKIHQMQGNWEAALKAAEYVLDAEPKNIKAILIKAEGLYNMCQFELALVFFHQGQNLAPDFEDFRLGIQKCRKTIQDTVSNPDIFNMDGLKGMFSILRKSADTQDMALASNFVDRSLNFGVAGGGLFGVVGVAKQFKERLKQKLTEKTDDKEVKEEEMEKRKIQSVLKQGNKSEADEQMPVMKVDRPNQSSDRLAKDKDYLTTLVERLKTRSDIAHDPVHNSIKKTTFETLEYLKKREQFWEQLELRKEQSANQHVESYRFLM